MPDGRGVPSRAELIELAAKGGGRLASGELARQLGLKGSAKAALKAEIRALKREGIVGKRNVDRGRGRGRGDGSPPGVAFVEVTELDADGELWGESPALEGVAILLRQERGQAVKPGDRALVRLETGDDAAPVGHVFKVLKGRPSALVGIVETGGRDGALWLRPTAREAKDEIRLAKGDIAVEPGDMVRVTVERSRPLAAPLATVVERLGRADDPHVISLAVATELALPMDFPQAAIDEAEAAVPVGLGGRVDLRSLPLVTIDGADARDFDDAVHARADDAPSNPGGFVATVAIADVAHYVTPGSSLDRSARERGNSVYFPDRVIPMLPEALSNGLCSLRPDEDCACLVCEMRIDRDGELVNWRFARGLMRSKARLTYDEVQAAREGTPGDRAAPLMAEVVAPLYACFDALLKARRKRGTIELDIPERVVRFDEARREIVGIEPRPRLASHMLIEEFMIAANVAAARTLAKKNLPLLYRVHDKPDPLKLESLADYAQELGISWNRQAKRPGEFSGLIARIEDPALREQLSMMVLRSQAQARYQPDNLGHFGLHLKDYAHFTSPIRRYADLTLHRQLIHHLNLAEPETGAFYPLEELETIGDEVSTTERKAVDAERRAMSRYVALFMAEHVGASFAGRITSVQRFGLFVTLDDTGAEGLAPVSSLGSRYFAFDERRHLLKGEYGGPAYGPGDRVQVVLMEADQAKGMLLFKVERHEPSPATKRAAEAGHKDRRVARGRRR